MRKQYLLAPALCVLVSMSACSSKQAKLGEETVTATVADGVQVTTTDRRSLTATGKIAGEETTLLTVKAKVEAVDAKTRLVTLRSPQGTVTTVKAGPEVRNFKQIDVGDIVRVDYYASIVFETRQPTAEELEASKTAVAGTARAKLGDKPGALAGVNTVSIVSVEAVDKKNNIVTVKDQAGNFRVVKAKYPENLNFIAKGDTVVATVTEAVAARVVEVKK